MEGALKLVGYKHSLAVRNVLYAARMANAPVEVDNLPWEDQTRRAELKPKIATATFPYLETPHGIISESNAIMQYLAEVYNASLLGANAFEKGQVRQWVEFANIEINRNSKALIYPLFGFYEFNKTDSDNATKDLKEQLSTLNRHLEGRSFVVGSNVTLADMALFSVLRPYFMLVFVEDQRKKLYANITAWFVNMANCEVAVRTYGRTVLCKVPAKAPKPAEKKEEPKKEEPKKEQKPAKKETTGDDDDEDKPKKKKANPLDLLPPSSFVLDDFKKEFLNTKDRPAVMKSFWEKIDLNGYSFYWMQYQKLASEGKILFKTVNSSSFFLQKLDTFRKYTFSVHGVYGEEDNYEVRGMWMWRGLDIPEEVREHDNFPYMTMKKMDPTSEADRAMIEEYWLKVNPGEVVDGMAVAEVVYFK